MITITNNALIEIKRRLGVPVDETELFTDAELIFFINKYINTKSESFTVVRIGDIYVPEKPVGKRWYSISYSTASGATYEEDTLNGVVTEVVGSGSSIDTDLTKTVTGYQINFNAVLADVLDAVAESTTKLARVIYINPGAQYDTVTLANAFRQQARRIKWGKWMD